MIGRLVVISNEGCFAVFHYDELALKKSGGSGNGKKV